MHEIIYETFSTKMSNKEIKERCQEIGERGDGLYSYVELLDRTFNTLQGAQEYLENHDEEYRCFGVKYRIQPPIKSARYEKLKLKTDECRTKYLKLANECYPQTLSAEYIGCKKCGSKLAKEYLTHRNDCPLCRNDLRPKTILDRIEKAKLAWDKAIETRENCALAEYKKNEKKKLPEEWLVKLEYHC